MEGAGIDAWLRRYSQWKERRLRRMAEMPLAELALQSLFLCACVLLDGVFLPWIVVVLAGAFSYPWFAILLLPTLAAEVLVYRKVKDRGTPRVSRRP